MNYKSWVKKVLRAVKKIIVSPSYFSIYMEHLGLYRVPDNKYLKEVYKARTGKDLNLENPKSFNEKIQWLKLHDRKPVYTTMVDKIEVKKYVSDLIGDEYIIPTLGVWDNPDDIDFDTLPDQFVLKCNHNSGVGMCICTDKSKLDLNRVRKELKKGLRQDYYKHGREWPYKNVKRKVLAEQFLKVNGKVVPEDYKVYCFDGKPKYIVVFHDRFNDDIHPSETVYDCNWTPQGISLDNHFEVSDIIEPKPSCLDTMLELSERLANGMPQARIDFYIIENNLYFGEITLSTASGFQPMIPEELDEKLGSWITLPENN